MAGDYGPLINYQHNVMLLLSCKQGGLVPTIVAIFTGNLQIPADDDGISTMFGTKSQVMTNRKQHST
jgi:hypothetical protein